MSIETAGLKQRAVLWPFSHYDNEGQPAVSATPEEVCVRWESTTRTIRGPKGSPIQLSADLMVDREITQGSQMWLGCLEDLPTDPNPHELHEVVSYDNIPDLNGRNPQRNVLLAALNRNLVPRD